VTGMEKEGFEFGSPLENVCYDDVEEGCEIEVDGERRYVG